MYIYIVLRKPIFKVQCIYININNFIKIINQNGNIEISVFIYICMYKEIDRQIDRQIDIDVSIDQIYRYRNIYRENLHTYIYIYNIYNI